MKYMGWSYGDLLECPADYLDIIADVSREEANN